MVKRKARLARFPAEWRGLGGVFAGPPRGQRRRGKVKLAGQRGHSVLNCLPVHVSARPLRSQFSDGSKAQGVAPQLLGADVEEEPADVLLKLWPEIVMVGSHCPLNRGLYHKLALEFGLFQDFPLL